jgi:hypothetical protein
MNNNAWQARIDRLYACARVITCLSQEFIVEVDPRSHKKSAVSVRPLPKGTVISYEIPLQERVRGTLVQTAKEARDFGKY